MSRSPRYQVKELAELAGISVRTLHHYDAIGLLPASDRSPAGYRLYSESDLLRLQQILIGRELGLSLEEIRRSLDEPDFDLHSALLSQRKELQRRMDRTHSMIAAIDSALSRLPTTSSTKDMSMSDKSKNPQTSNIRLSRDEAKALFAGFDPSAHEDEAKARWGDSEAYAESARRTRGYSKADWQRYKIESSEILQRAAALFGARTAPESDEGRALAEEHRCLIDRWFYPCSPHMHARLADMYEADDRFQRNIDVHAEGLTGWLAAAIRASEPEEA